MSTFRRITRRAVIAAGLAVLAGCSSAADRLTAVSGRVTVPNGDPAVLAGSAVEVSLVSDPAVRAFGTIDADGTFTLETYRDGRVRRGAPEGTYKARIVLSDDDAALKKKAAKAVPARFQTFGSSGLTLRVPAGGAVTLAVR
jgi:hypothetical protein